MSGTSTAVPGGPIEPDEPGDRKDLAVIAAPIDVMKVGGHELDDPAFVAGLARAVAALRAAGRAVVVVHGGGRAIADLQHKLGLAVHVVDGLRVTDDAGLDVAEMVLSGLSNKRLVAAFLAAGLDAIGLSGVDRGLLRCRPIEHPTADLGRVGTVEHVRVDVLLGLLADGVVPIVSPISLGPDDRSWNVNADTAAAAIAGALGAARLALVSNVPGVRLGDGVAAQLDAAAVEAAIARGAIHGGMVPKVGAAFAALDAGVGEAWIVDLAGLASGRGTAIVATRPAANGVAGTT